MNDSIIAELSIKEREQLRSQTIEAMRARLDERKPHASDYAAGDSQDARFIASVLTYSRIAVPVIAVLAALASSVRTVQVVSTLYTDAGSAGIGVLIASVAFTLAAEGALFFLALAQAGEHIRARAERRARYVMSAAGLWRSLLVRVGTRPALRHDELPDSGGGIGVVILLALLFTLSTNLYLGLKPLWDEIGAASLQTFVSGLIDAPAQTQMTAFVDFLAALFAPLVAFSAGHQTAKFAAEIAERSQASKSAYEADMTAWREARANPLATEEGQELFEEYVRLKVSSKAARRKPAPAHVENPTRAESLTIQPIPHGMIPTANGKNGNGNANGHHA